MPKAMVKAVAQLKAIEVCCLGEIEVRTIGQAGEDQFVCEMQLRIGERRVLREGRDVVVEVVVVKREIVGTARTEDRGPSADKRVEAIERVLAFGSRA